MHTTPYSAMHFFCSIEFDLMDGSDYQILEFLAIRLSPEVDKSSFQDEDTEQQIYKHFPVKNSDRLFATAAPKFLKVLGSIRLSLQLCKILVQFCNLRHLGPYSGHLESVLHYPR